MKKIVSITLLLIITINAKSQTNYTPLGTWKYVNGLDTIEMFFKVGQLTNGLDTFPIIKGYHKYVKNGQLVESNMQFANSALNRFSIILYNIFPSMPRLDGSINDLTLNYRKYIIFKKINATTIDVTLTSYESWQKTPPSNINYSSYTLPRHFTLTKY